MVVRNIWICLWVYVEEGQYPPRPTVIQQSLFFLKIREEEEDLSQTHKINEKHQHDKSDIFGKWAPQLFFLELPSWHQETEADDI